MSGVDFGDIAGLHALAAAYKRHGPEFEGTARALDRQVTDLTADAWSGETAAAFKAAWEKDSQGGQALSEIMGRVAGTVERLADALGRAKRDYEHAVATAAEQGVPIVAPGQEASVCLAPEAQRLSDGLSADVAAALKLADAAREQAIAELEPVFAVLDPNHAVMGPAEAKLAARLGLGDWVDMGAFFADLYAVPGVAARLQRGRVAKLAAAYARRRRTTRWPVARARNARCMRSCARRRRTRCAI